MLYLHPSDIEQWSQCRKIGYNPAPQPNGIVGIWDQCGGEYTVNFAIFKPNEFVGAAWDGATRCEAGTHCEYRWQYVRHLYSERVLYPDS